MKKFVCLFASVLLFCAAASSQKFNLDGVKKTDKLLHEGLYKNLDEIEKIADELSPEEKELLYVMHKKSDMIPSIANYYIGYGIGSFLQGDTKTAIPTLILHVTGVLVADTGIVLWLYPYIAYEWFGSHNPESLNLDEFEIYKNLGYGFIAAGAAVVLASKMFSVIKAHQYTDSYNETLKKAVLKSEDEKISLTMSPLVNVADKRYGLIVTMNF